MKSALVTGGTGFFGRNFVHEVLSSGLCDRICVYSRGEASQAEMRDRIDPAVRDKVRFFIGDVRDRDRLRRAMGGVDTVIHAAALKRIEVGHYNPIEMVRTNVDGAINVIEASMDASVRHVIYLSTDKAWHPCSAYGHSKALAESLFLAANNTTTINGPKFVVTRYGNVFNSTGSIVPKWLGLIASGHTRVPVTDPNCTRFFMTAKQAVHLVLEAVDQAKNGKAGKPWKNFLVPELPAYRVGDLAAAMGVEMDIVGLPKFEKMHEGMEDGNTSDVARLMSVSELASHVGMISGNKIGVKEKIRSLISELSSLIDAASPAVGIGNGTYSQAI